MQLQRGGVRSTRERMDPSQPIVTSCASLCSRMEKLGSEVATLFTHSHVVSLVVSSRPSPFFRPSSDSLGSRQPFFYPQLFQQASSTCPEHHLDSVAPPFPLPFSQNAAACLLGQLGQQGVTFDLQPREWIAAAAHALSAPAEVRHWGRPGPFPESSTRAALQKLRSGKRVKKPLFLAFAS